jgi:hypothetical protein
MLENLTPPVSVLPCKVRTILGNLESTDRDILISALNDRLAWKDYVLSEQLTQRGVSVSPNSIRKHRRLQCSCGLLNA